MSDLRTRLDQIGDRARPDPDAFARLERTRRRRERNRRIEAGVVAFAIAIAGSIYVLSAFRGGNEPTIGGGVSDSFVGIWPESSREAAQAVQEAVDSGDPALAWRLDAGEVALAFARNALGWSDALLDHSLADTSISSPISVVTPPGSCPSPPLPACLPRHAIIELQRLEGAPSGIWSVVAVRSDAFDVPVSPGEEVVVGGFLAIPTTLEEGAEVAVGVAGTGSCSGFAEQTAIVLDAKIVLPIRGVSEGCNGYLYALTPSTPVGQVELGRIMFAYQEPRPGLEYTIDAIAAVPVRFVLSSVEPLPEDSLHVTCDRTTIGIDGRAVSQAPGVHVIVENTATQSLSFVFAANPQGPMNAMPVEPGMAELALQLPPGLATFYCIADFGEVATDQVQVEVQDPQGLFVPFDLTCPGEPVLASTIPVAVWPDGASRTIPEPVEFVRTVAEGLLPSDVVERAAYPEAPNVVVRVVRDGAVVAEFELYQPDDWAPGMVDGWAAGMTACAGSDISIPPGPDPYPRGAFKWCPDGPLGEPGFQWQERATEAAIQFVLAYKVNGDEATLRALLDASVPAGAEFPIALAEDVATAIGADAHGGELVNFACGNDVDAYTVAITIDDGTDSASLDFTVYLVFRGADGWKVWAVY